MMPPIIVTGAARSGTSMTAGVLNICGAFGGNMAGPNQFNQKGMFENTTIRNAIQKPYLSSIGCDPLGQKPLPNNRQVFEVTDQFCLSWRERVESVFVEQGYKGGPWFYKGAKCCLIWYVWHMAFPTAKWVIVRRDREDIIRSCIRTRFMSRYTDEAGWGHWVDAHLRRFDQMVSAGLDTKEVWPAKMIQGDFSEIKEVVEYLKLKWEDDLVRSFIEPKYWGGKK